MSRTNLHSQARRGSFALAVEDALMIDEIGVPFYALSRKAERPSRLMRTQILGLKPDVSAQRSRALLTQEQQRLVDEGISVGQHRHTRPYARARARARARLRVCVCISL